MGSILTLFRDIVFPPLCAVCGVWLGIPSKGNLCQTCLDDIEKIKPPVCPICGRPFEPSLPTHLCGRCLVKPPPYDTCQSAFVYKGTIRKLIHAVKYVHDGYALKALKALGPYDFLINDHVIDLIVPVPLHPGRLRSRGSNQALQIARVFFPSLPTGPMLIERTVDTPSQTGLSKKDRKKNVKNAFKIKGPCPDGIKRVLLVDDVFTTGATVEACARALKRGGIKEVHVFTLARVIASSQA